MVQNGGIQMKSKNQIDMLNGSIVDKIIMFAMPLAASSILQQLFNSADVAVVGKYAGSDPLAAVGSTSPVINMLINIFVGLSVGANVVAAKYYGIRDEKKISDTVHTSILLAFISGIFLIFLGFFLSKPILSAMSTPDNILDMATMYMRIYFLGMPFIMLYNFGSAILRSVGDTKRPLYSLAVAGVVNILLNLFFVIVCDLSIAGVAIATVISNVISSSMIVYFLIKETGPIHLNLRKLKIKKEILIQIAKVGIPSGVQGMMFSISNVIIQSSINSFGTFAVSGSAAALNYEYYVYYLLAAFGQAATTFCGQNFGAGQKERCHKILKVSGIMTFVSTLVVSLIFAAFGRQFLRVFTDDPNVIEYGIVRMKIVLTLEAINAVCEVISGALRGMGHPTLPALISLLGVCGLRLLYVFTVLPHHHTFDTLMLVYPITWTVTLAALVISYKIIYKKILKTT